MNTRAHACLLAVLFLQGALPKVRVAWGTGDQYPLALDLLIQLTTADKPPQHALHVRRVMGMTTVIDTHPPKTTCIHVYAADIIVPFERSVCRDGPEAFPHTTWCRC